MRRKQLTPLLFIIAVAIAGVSLTFITDTTPELGLDLQGGVSVVLQPTTEASDEALTQTIEIIRSRVDALGVSEAPVSKQGSAIVVQLPGVKNQQRALELVGDTAELRFRPVLASASRAQLEAAATSSTTSPDGSSTTTTATDGGATTTTAAVEGQSEAATPFQDPSTTTTTVAGGATTTTVAPEPPAVEITPREDDVADQPVTLEGDGPDGEPYVYELGPAGATGKIVEDADARLGQNGQWTVPIVITSDGIDEFNKMASDCFNRTEVCPTGQLAIVLDSVVESAPVIEQATFDRSEIQISGSFSEGEAKDLALVLRYGSLPVNLEPQTVQTVSPTLGRDSLHAGLIAGFVGLALVVLYMLVYYRALGLVVLVGLMVWSALVYTVICWLGATRGLALSLAGVAGLVVSVGITVDSYVVYFERLKDDVRLGRTLRSSTERSWKRAFRTIIAANVSSLIGATVLYMLTVGPVRGFAFFLGLATAMDIVVAYFFIRPVVALMGQSSFFTSDRWWGVGRGLGQEAHGEDVDLGDLPAAAPHRSLWSKLYHGETTFDFVGRFRTWVVISLVVIAVGAVSLGNRGLNLGIDFEGGVVWEVPVGDSGASVSDAEDAVGAAGVDAASVQTLEAEGETRIRVQSEAVDLDTANEVSAALAELTGTDVDEVSLTSVGPSWGREISEKAIRALVIFLIVLTLYISFRFELKMAIATVVALLHDILITIGIYSLTGFEVTPATVVSLLTILGFSIYDGIVVFDKVDENTKLVGSTKDLTYGGMVNLSLNQVLMRSLNTSITALLPVASLLILGSWVMGATTLEEFALALLVGLFAGAYSSIFIASPLLAVLKEREPRYRELKSRIEGRQVPVPERPDGEPAREEATVGVAAPAPTLSGRPIPPRPRKKGKKR